MFLDFLHEVRRFAASRLRRLREPRALLGFGLVVLVLALGLSLNVSGGSDDCYITFWSALSLAQRGELTNYNGEILEQSSSLLHTVVLAVVHLITGIGVPVAAWVLGVAALALAGFRAGRLFQLFFPGRPAAPFWLPAAVCASGILSYNATNGLETTLAAYVYLEYCIQLVEWTQASPRGRSRLVKLGLVTACVITVRPEAMFIFGLLIVAAGVLRALFAGRRTWRSFAAPFVLIVTASALLLTGRYATTGEWFPGPVLAKTGTAPGQRATRMLEGFQYLLEAFSSPEGWLFVLALILIAVVAYRTRKTEGTAPLIVLLALSGQAGFVVTSGGDWMPAARFWAHILPLAHVTVVAAVAGAGAQAGGERPAIAGSWGVALTAIGLLGAYDVASTRTYARTFWNYRQVAPLLHERLRGATQFDWTVKSNLAHTRDIPTLHAFGRILRELKKVVPRPQIVSSQAGMVGYYLARDQYGSFRFDDLNGLVSHRFLKVARTLDSGSSRSGLTLGYADLFAFANDSRKFEFKPDIIFDTKEARRNAVTRNGYVVVYEQSGEATNAYFPDSERCSRPAKRRAGKGNTDTARARVARRLEGESVEFFPRAFRLHQFIAIRKDHAVRLGWLSATESAKAVEVNPPFFQRVRWDEAELLTEWQGSKPPFGCPGPASGR